MDVDTILGATRRATEITRRLLAFGRKRERQAEVVDLNALTMDLSRMLRRLISDAIHLQLDLDPSVGRVRADASQLEQILMNLVVNARDAMPSGGNLTVETRAARHADLPQGSRATTNMIALRVSDSGVGMDETTIKQLFEPFFTTKPFTILRMNGFQVSEARDGKEALEAASRAGALDLVVTDVVMPSMGGPELVNELRRDAPRLRVVFMSGHTFDWLDTEKLDVDVDTFLPKPFTPDQLKTAVERILAA